MEGLASLVNTSLARHGFDIAPDHSRIQWSKWFRCESSFSMLLVPAEPGLFALGEEVAAPGELPSTGGKRMLALFQVSEADDLGLALGRLFAPGSPDRDRLLEGRCFARYAVIEDALHRKAAHAAFQQWLASSTEAATGISNSPDASWPRFAGNETCHAEPAELQTDIDPPAPLPSGF
jgi:hypothetical protein